MRAAGVPIDLRQWDARALPQDDGTIDRIVSNLPWGRQVEVDTELAPFYQTVCAEIERVLADDGEIVLLTNVPHLVTFASRSSTAQYEISLFGQQPTILVFGSTTTMKS